MEHARTARVLLERLGDLARHAEAALEAGDLDAIERALGMRAELIPRVDAQVGVLLEARDRAREQGDTGAAALLQELLRGLLTVAERVVLLDARLIGGLDVARRELAGELERLVSEEALLAAYNPSGAHESRVLDLRR